MSVTNILKTDTFDTFRIKSNTIASELGDNARLVANPTLSATTAVDAVLETLIKVETEVGIIGALTTTAPTLVGAINEHDAELGVLSTLTTTQKGTIVGSINELDAEVGVLSTLTTTQKGTIVGSINELDAELGVLSTLTTTAKGTIVSSINEVVQRETDRYNNTLKLDLADATVGGTNSGTQTILSNVNLTAGHTLTIPGTLDISVGTLIVGGAGGNLNIQTTFLTLGDRASPTAVNGGLIIARGNDGVNDRPDVRLYWDESDKKWHFKKLDDAGTSTVTPFVLDSYNIKDFVTGNTENGLSVTYDQSTSKFNFDVNDFTITLAGDVAGSATVTDLGSVTINTTVQPNMVALGTDTTGAYIRTFQLDPTTPGISLTSVAGTGGENHDISLVKVDSTVVRTFGTQSIAGVKTFSDKPVFSSGITTSASSTLHSLNITNDLVVGGTLTVNGTVTTVNTESINLADNIITVNSNYIGSAPTENGGLEVERGTLTNVNFVWDETQDDWSFYNGTNTYYATGQIVAGNAITVSQDATEKARWTVNHADTSSQASVDNSNGTVIQDITLDTYGHITALASYDLDNRYFTETEADNRFVNVTGDTMTGTLTIAPANGTFTGNLTGNADTASSAAKWTTARKITLSGDLTGNITFDGTSDLTWSVAVNDDSHNHVIGNIDNFVEEVQDIVGGMFSPVNVENGISIYYDDTNGKINSDVNDFTITISGAAKSTNTPGNGVVSNLGNVTIETEMDTTSTQFVNSVKALMPKIYNVSGTQVFP